MQNKIIVNFENGLKKEYAEGVTYYEVSKDYQENMSSKIIGVKVNNEIIPMNNKVKNNDQVRFFDASDINGYKMNQSGLKFVLEVALKETFGKKQLLTDVKPFIEQVKSGQKTWEEAYQAIIQTENIKSKARISTVSHQKEEAKQATEAARADAKSARLEASRAKKDLAEARQAEADAKAQQMGEESEVAARAKQYCEDMYQIGIDVLPEYRRQGIASALTSKLALEVLKLDKVPFYCTAWCNLKSARNAIKCGFAPAWVELTARDIDFVNEFNRGLKL